MSDGESPQWRFCLQFIIISDIFDSKEEFKHLVTPDLDKVLQRMSATGLKGNVSSVVYL